MFSQHALPHAPQAAVQLESKVLSPVPVQVTATSVGTVSRLADPAKGSRVLTSFHNVNQPVCEHNLVFGLCASGNFVRFRCVSKPPLLLLLDGTLPSFDM